MAVMYSFCIYFSVRLGAILVALSSMIQSLIIGGVFLYWLNNIEQSRESLQYWISLNKLIYVTDLFQSVQQNTELYLQSAVVFLMLHIGTSTLLIYGAFKCNVPLMWPYIFVELLRLIILLLFHVTAMMLTKENLLDLGALITLSLSGGFILLGLYYSWFCVVSLCQCIQELRDTQSNSNQDSNVNFLAMDYKHLTDVAKRLHTSQNYSLQAVHTLRNVHSQHDNMVTLTY